MPCAISYSFVDTNGQEIVKAYGTPIQKFQKDATSNIVTTTQLNNISDKKYFSRFIKLNKNQLGISNIFIDKSDDLIRPAIVLAKAIYKDDKVIGFIETKLCLYKLLDLLKKTTLYNIDIIDSDGTFVSTKVNNKIELLNYNVSQKYKKEIANQIINNNEYIGTKIYSAKIEGFDNNQSLKILMSLKFEKLTSKEQDNRQIILYTMIAFILLASPIVVYFSKLPDRLLSELKEQLVTDKLTNFPNRVQLFQDLGTNKDNIIMLIYIENLKKLLSVYGYETIDEIMIKVSKAIDEYIGGSHIEYKVYVFANHNIAIKFKYSSDNNLNYISRSIHNHLERIYITLENGIDISLDIAIGISDPYNIKNSNDEFKEAEIALERAVSSKSDIVIFDYKSSIISKNKELLETVKTIKQCIESRNIILHYQPIYNNKTKKIEKYETLMRIEDNDGYILYPNSFLDVAKDAKKYQKLTNIMVDKSFRYFKDKDYEFSINLSADDIYTDGFIDYISNKINEYKISQKLVIEIVESESIHNYDKFHDFIKLMKKLGCKIAIDDFGSGYSNFEHIINLSDYIDYIKIDGSLIKNIVSDTKSQILVNNIQILSNSLKIKTIAEFVENKEILEYISDLDIDYSQGYYISKPLADIKQ
jgi:EAL domain-containing protein (putative c-di-GMP-specific phosphodiesterase class I)/GGDEF domain-containing protein